ncbi:MAG: 16S rRNA (cytosine(967)-C(5))-methyltransferase RsmB, partial [Burkholderiales bacterium]
FALARLASRPPQDRSLAPLLWVALHQLEHTPAAHYAVVDHAVDCAGSIGGKAVKRFANAVLRGYLRSRSEIQAAAKRDDEARFSYPRWWIEKAQSELGPAAAAVLDSGNLHPPLTLRVNLRKTSVEDYVAQLRGHALDARVCGVQAVRVEKPVPVDELPGFRDGLVSVQDAGAQRSAPLLELAAGQHVVDACSAPGGKASHILELADVDLTALDSDALRLQRVVQNFSRLGVSGRVIHADAADLDAWWDGKPVDRVLLDAPCSASGVVRRHPDIKWLRRPADIARFCAQQERLLEALWKVLARGGKLLYVTCSIFREENQTQIGGFLSRHADARHLVGAPGIDGLLLPTEEHDGFFHALFEKT